MANHRISGIVAAALGAGMLIAISSLPAAAQEPTGPTPLPGASEPWGNGFYYLLDFTLGDAENPETDADFSVDLDWSAGVGLGLGYRVGPLRLEGEFTSEFFRVGSLDLGPASPFLAGDYSGGMHALSAMANVFIDLPAAGRMRPYLGAGYGLARVNAEYNTSVCILFCFSTTNEVVEDWDWANAWQAMAGLSFSKGAGDVEWFVGYRYYETEDLNLRTISGVFFTQDGLKDHSIMFGFRFLVN